MTPTLLREIRKRLGLTQPEMHEALCRAYGLPATKTLGAAQVQQSSWETGAALIPAWVGDAARKLIADTPTVLCAWCEATIREGGPVVSHGACEACAEELTRRIG